MSRFDYIRGGGLNRKERENLRKRVYDRDGNKCLKCGSKDDLTLDHIKPCSKGGKHEFNNLQTLCGSCNSRKGNNDEISYVKRKKIELVYSAKP